MRQPAIRNVILVGPAGAGKTTLAESLLAAAGAVRQPGTVATGSTTSDHNEIETELGRSVVLTPLSFSFADTRITLLDTPGFADFVGEVRAGLRAADAALFVVGAGEGIDAATIMLWQECAAVGMPRAVVVTGVDRGGDFDEEISLARRAFGDGVQPMYLPMLADDESLAGLIGLLTQSVYDYSTGTRTSRESDPQHRELVEEARAALIEGIITESEDETLMERFLGGEELAIDMLVDDLEKAVARGHFHPVLPVGLDPQRPVGMLEVLELIVGGFPTPAEHPLPTATTPDGRPGPALACDPQGPLCAEVVQTTSDQFAGRLSLVRVFSGTLRADTVLHVSGHFLSDRGHDDHDTDERAGAISSALGAQLTPVSAGVAGDIVTVARLSRAETGDTLSDPATPLLVEPWLMPDPLLPLAVSADSRQDEDKLSTALGRLQAEDPTVRIERNAETHQVVLWSMGQTHADVLLDRLRRRFGVHVTAEPLKIALRTTLAGPAKGHGRLVKQSGGHGQYAVVDIEVRPMPRGSGYTFVDKVVGGAVPRQFISSVDKGLQQQMAAGLDSGYPVVDLEVTLVDGKAHSVDSSDMAFATAAGLALKEAAAAAGEVLLEPVAEVSIDVSDEYVGAVMSDLASRRGRMTGSESLDGGRTRVAAVVPASELTRYSIDLRAISHGSATFTRSEGGYEPLPDRLRASVLG